MVDGIRRSWVKDGNGEWWWLAWSGEGS